MDLFALLGIPATQPKPTKVKQYLEVSIQALRAWKILVKDEKDGFLVRQDNTRSNHLFCAPYDPDLEARVNALFGKIQLIREQAAVEEAKVRREIFQLLKAKREGECS